MTCQLVEEQLHLFYEMNLFVMKFVIDSHNHDLPHQEVNSPPPPPDVQCY